MDSRGNRGDTQRKLYWVAREILTDVPILSGQLMDIRKRSSTGSVRKSELPIVPLTSQRQHNFEREKGQYLHRVSDGEKERRLR
jgi:hypothetical protein